MDATALTEALTTGLTSIATNIVTVASAVIPIGLGIFGMTMAVGYAKSFFKKITG